MVSEKTNALPGDKVEIHFVNEIYEGTLLESPENEKGIVLLKLGNGYNMGFNKKDIQKIKVVKKSKLSESELNIKHDSKKPNVAIIITGGTIASKYDSRTGAVHPLDSPESLLKFYPELYGRVNVTKIAVPFMKFSEDMGYKDWQKIAKVCEELLNDETIQGIIITHGTDFLHYTASALSFFLGKLNKPVVLTYSQRSIDRASSDANLNLKCSAEIAGLSDIAEVVLVGHANSEDNFCYVMPGTKVRKMHSSRRDAFKIINGNPIAKVDLNAGDRKLEILEKYNRRDNGRKVKSDLKYNEKVALIKFFPGQSTDILDFYSKEKYNGLVIEMSGLGHVSDEWVKKIKEIISKGIVVCATSQCINGRVDGLVYSTGRKLIDAGVIYLKDMISETALVKLGFVLGHSDWKVKEKMLENISGEIGERLEFE